MAKEASGSGKVRQYLSVQAASSPRPLAGEVEAEGFG
jgi:hypothetical protein